MTQLVDGASGIVEYLIDAAAGRAGPSAADRAAGIAALGPVIAAVGNPVEIELYIERIAQRFSISDLRVVKEQLRQGVRTGAKGHPTPAATSGSTATQPTQLGSTTKVASAQERVKLPQLPSELLGALLDKPELFRSQYAENLKELLTVAELQAIFSAAAAQVAERGTLDAPRLLAKLAGNSALAWLQERLSVETYSDDAEAEQVLRRGIPFLAKQNIEGELPRLAQRIQLARQRGDESEAIALTRQRHELAMHAHQLVKGVKR
jgi:DNA primase